MKKYALKSKVPVKVFIIAAALSVFVFSCLGPDADKSDVTLTAKDRNEPSAVKASDKNYSTFSHSVAEHEKIECDSCHKREGNSAAPKFPGHESCVSCHLNEFTNTKSGMCAMCHDDLKVIPATMKPFPHKFNEGFNMKFDHASHMSGAGKPPQGCASCHFPSGAAQTIPVGQQAHNQCFACHTPESNIGSCNVCHDIAPYKRTAPTSVVFNAVFRHSDHTGRQGVSCSECHTVRAGAPQSRQVAVPSAVQHFSSPAAVSCRTCHNDSRAFGEKDFANCKRCHSGPGFDMIQ